jgi:hypothetical protein
LIDGSHADGPLFITGSLGDDTITGGPFSDFVDGGGGNDTINVTGGGSDQVNCSKGSKGSVHADPTDILSGCSNTTISNVTGSTGPTGATGSGGGVRPALSHARFAPKTVTITRHTTLKLKLKSTTAGTLSAAFLLPTCKHAHGCTHFISAGSLSGIKAKAGSQTVKLADKIKVRGRKRALAAGTYSVLITLTAGGVKSAPVAASLTVRSKH